jgi:acyl-CoA thioesterase-1
MWTFLLCLSCTVQSTLDQTSTDIATETVSEVTKSPVKTEALIEDKPRVIILGDSLTAGLGLDVNLAYPSLVASQLNELGYPTEIINAGQSGDTTAGGLRRVDWLLKQNPDLLIVELGANDGMRGIPLTEIEKNLNGIIDKAQNKDTPVFLMDMYIPSNFGKEYTDGFHDIYDQIAKEQSIPLIPFLLQEVAGKPELNQADGIHPTAEGHELMADVVRESIKEWRMTWTSLD